ncbi:DUF5004 domain-containing protein [Hugenholtzia roseola]|uniref:DUF5004 domain-containing protein n=1 Tax=Hugenholtzia roseola TaxID=1002 RepID=UPI000410BFCC|nr:DUF5004 domain-containing protein [Hugenholtzia roseola]
MKKTIFSFAIILACFLTTLTQAYAQTSDSDKELEEKIKSKLVGTWVFQNASKASGLAGLAATNKENALAKRLATTQYEGSEYTFNEDGTYQHKGTDFLKAKFTYAGTWKFDDTLLVLTAKTYNGMPLDKESASAWDYVIVSSKELGANVKCKPAGEEEVVAKINFKRK